MSGAVLSSVFFFDAYNPNQDTAVTWGGVMIFDFVVVVLTIIRTMKIKRRSRKVHTLTDLLMRDGESFLWQRF